ncbi:Global transcription regulator sge1 [Coemansia sp. RSA 2598]|nr:Global transcription regulator sge1 [Coemansia sp. RSA 2598]
MDIDPQEVISPASTPPTEVVIGGPGACFTVTGLRIQNTRDALTVFEACRQGLLPRVVRRLNDDEKQQIDDGTVVVFDEKEAKMKRWTDGRLWTPSRILGNFLVYRELEKKLQPNQEGAAEVAKWQSQQKPSAAAYGSNKGVFYPQAHGLIKRTISLAVPDNEDEFYSRSATEYSGSGQRMNRMPRVHQQHLISYFRAESSYTLPAPDDIEELRLLRLPIALLRIQRFRRPVKIGLDEDGLYTIHDSDAEEEVDDTGKRVYKALNVAASAASASANASADANADAAANPPPLMSPSLAQAAMYQQQQQSLDAPAINAEHELAQHQAYQPMAGFSQPLLLQSAFFPEPPSHNMHLCLSAPQQPQAEMHFPLHVSGHLDPGSSGHPAAPSGHSMGSEQSAFVHSSEYILGASMPALNPSYQMGKMPDMPLDASNAAHPHPSHCALQPDAAISPDQMADVPSSSYLAEIYGLAQFSDHFYSAENHDQTHDQGVSSKSTSQSVSQNIEHF